MRGNHISSSENSEMFAKCNFLLKKTFPNRRDCVKSQDFNKLFKVLTNWSIFNKIEKLGNFA